MVKRAALFVLLLAIAVTTGRLKAAPTAPRLAASHPALSPQQAGPTAARNADAGATLTQYCVTCHNERLKTGGLVIDPASAAAPEASPEMWEKVVRKLRAQSMPPAGPKKWSAGRSS